MLGVSDGSLLKYSGRYNTGLHRYPPHPSKLLVQIVRIDLCISSIDRAECMRISVINDLVVAEIFALPCDMWRGRIDPHEGKCIVVLSVSKTISWRLRLPGHSEKKRGLLTIVQRLGEWMFMSASWLV